mgnify:CR=1 FL=1
MSAEIGIIASDANADRSDGVAPSVLLPGKFPWVHDYAALWASFSVILCVALIGISGGFATASSSDLTGLVLMWLEIFIACRYSDALASGPRVAEKYKWTLSDKGLQWHWGKKPKGKKMVP